MNILRLQTADSTNTWLKENRGEIPPMTLVCAFDQSAGRGQRGNTWESEPGKNITCSFHFNPDDESGKPVRPAQQFVISEAVALAVVTTLRDFGIDACVKWPNDIYAGDKKICGILIENSIMGQSISCSIVGIGLNVNQDIFLSDAPNPVSMSMIAGHSFPLEDVERALGRNLELFIGRIGQYESLHPEYIRNLWRGGGRLFPYRDAASGRLFSASIEDVEPSGHLILKTEGETRRFAFKEVVFVL